jgi:hypothetical protein
MTDRHKGGSGADFSRHAASHDKEAVTDRLRAEKKSATAAASDAAEAVKKEAGAVGEEVRHFAEDQADKVKDATASHMDVFADALKAASDELEKNHVGPAAELVTHAASGLENLSRSLHGKSTGAMLDTVRQFGRENPLGFLAGSLLAGFALSRFAAAGMPSASGTDGAAAVDRTATARSNASPPPPARSPQTSSPASRPPGGATTASSSRGGTQR